MRAAVTSSPCWPAVSFHATGVSAGPAIRRLRALGRPTLQGGWCTNTFGFVQLFRWLALNGGLFTGRWSLLRPPQPFQGHARNVSLGVTFQPTGRLSQEVAPTTWAFDRESTGERVYTVTVVNSKTTYQFTRALALRAIAQYRQLAAARAHRLPVVVQPRPGTVVYVGYGSLARAARLRGWAAGSRRGHLSNDAAGTIPEGVVLLSLLKCRCAELLAGGLRWAGRRNYTAHLQVRRSLALAAAGTPAGGIFNAACISHRLDAERRRGILTAAGPQRARVGPASARTCSAGVWFLRALNTYSTV